MTTDARHPIDASTIDTHEMIAIHRPFVANRACSLNSSRKCRAATHGERKFWPSICAGIRPDCTTTTTERMN